MHVSVPELSVCFGDWRSAFPIVFFPSPLTHFMKEKRKGETEQSYFCGKEKNVGKPSVNVKSPSECNICVNGENAVLSNWSEYCLNKIDIYIHIMIILFPIISFGLSSKTRHTRTFEFRASVLLQLLGYGSSTIPFVLKYPFEMLVFFCTAICVTGIILYRVFDVRFFLFAEKK